ncbi:Hypothetical_protein [Hexamita inflata]|uniref:Hypothetical_protein n=1 Tax=Hexamita inflata TaxID=28002 RepID=A0ABP1JTZ4_9EUKA
MRCLLCLIISPSTSPLIPASLHIVIRIYNQAINKQITFRLLLYSVRTRQEPDFIVYSELLQKLVCVIPVQYSINLVLNLVQVVVVPSDPFISNLAQFIEQVVKQKQKKNYQMIDVLIQTVSNLFLVKQLLLNAKEDVKMIVILLRCAIFNEFDVVEELVVHGPGIPQYEPGKQKPVIQVQYFFCKCVIGIMLNKDFDIGQQAISQIIGDDDEKEVEIEYQWIQTYMREKMLNNSMK